MNTRAIAAIAVVVGVSGFFVLRAVLNFNIDGPPERALAPATAEVADSTVMAELEVPLAQLEQALFKALARDSRNREKPLLSGNTEQIAWDAVGNLFSGKRKTRPSCEVTAAQRTATKFVKCWDGARGNDLEKAWHRTKCTTEYGLDSLGDARDLAVACVPKALDVALPNRPTKLPYRVFLEDLGLKMVGNSIAADTTIRIDLQPPQDLHKYFVTNAKAYECAARINASANLALKLQADGKRLKIKTQTGDVRITPGKTCGGKRPAGLANEIDKILLSTSSQLFQSQMQEQLEKVLNDPKNLDLINDQLSVLPQFLAQDFRVPLPEQVPAPVSLSISPQALAVSDVSGNGSEFMQLAVGVTARPVVKLAAAPPLVPWDTLKPNPDKALALTLRTPDNRFEVRPQLSLSLDAVTDTATQIANQVVADVLPNLRYRSLSVTLYQAEERLVIGVDLRGVTWLRLNGSVFLTATPYVSEGGKALQLRDIQFDAGSEDFLTRRALWVLETGIESVLEERLTFNLDGPMAQALDAMKDLTVALDVEEKNLGTLNIALQDIALDQLWINENELNLSVVASGRAAVAVKALP